VFAGVLVEVPLRVAWHGGCFVAHACCCVPPCTLLTAAQHALQRNPTPLADASNEDDDDNDGEQASTATSAVGCEHPSRTGAAIAAEATVCECLFVSLRVFE